MFAHQDQFAVYAISGVYFQSELESPLVGGYPFTGFFDARVQIGWMIDNIDKSQLSDVDLTDYKLTFVKQYVSRPFYAEYELQKVDEVDNIWSWTGTWKIIMPNSHEIYSTGTVGCNLVKFTENMYKPIEKQLKV